MMNFLEDNRKALEAFKRISSIVGARVDYVQGGGGNTSVKLGNGLMAIKASGYCLKDIDIDKAYAVVDGAALRKFFYENTLNKLGEDAEKIGTAKVKESIKAIDGLAAVRPSVEAGFHSVLDKFVVHTHPIWGNLATCCQDCEAIVAEAMRGANYTYGVVPYADPGTCLTFYIRDEIERVTEETGKRPAVIFLKNHGVIVHGDDPERCLGLQEDVNQRVAMVFDLTVGQLPDMKAFLTDKIKTGEYGERFFLEESLYPDQIVFLKDTLSFGRGKPAEGCCVVNPDDGTLCFNMPDSKAKVILETMFCVAFIANVLKENGKVLATMDEAAKRFIANWESEKYRKSLAG